MEDHGDISLLSPRVVGGKRIEYGMFCLVLDRLSIMEMGELPPHHSNLGGLYLVLATQVIAVMDKD